MTSFSNSFRNPISISISFRFLLLITLIFAFAKSNDAIQIVSRSEWNARAPKSVTKITKPLDYIIIHHTAGTYCSDKSGCSTQMRSIQNYHMDTNHWDDIAYHYAIGGDGKVYEGRGAGVQGSHAKGWNQKSYGVVFIGNYNNSQPSQAQMKALQQLMDWLVQQHYIARNYKVYGHRQVRSTECPGNKLYNEVVKLPNWHSK